MKDKMFEALVKSRTIVISEPVSSELVEKTTRLLTFMENESQTKPVTVLVNSPGGEAYSGLGLYDTLRFVRCPITVVVNGLCASAAVLVLLAVPKERRFSLPNSRFMIHQPSGGARGTSSDIQIEATEIKALRSIYFKIIGEACGKDPEEARKDADRDFWINPEDARDYGLISKVITQRGEID
jgi:ATP-dependent Clp protease, protease subunit